MAFPGDYTLLGKKTLPTITGMHFDFVQLLKYDDFDYTYVGGETLTGSMLDYLDNGGGDLRFSSDAAGSFQLPCEVVQFDKVGNSIQVWVKIPFAFTGIEVFIWGDNTGDSQPAVTDPFGRNAVWSDYSLGNHLDGTGLLNSSNGVSGTFENGTPTQGTGQIGDGRIFDTEGINTGETLADGLSEFSISAWVRWDGGLQNPEGSLIDRWGDSEQSYLLRYETGGGGAFEFFTVDGGISGGNFSGTSLSDGQIHHVMATINSGTMEMYLDGVKSSRTRSSGTPNSTSVVAKVGRSNANNSGNDFWKGLLDEVRVRDLATTEDFNLTEYQNQSSVGEWGVTSGIAGGGSGIVIEGQTALYDYQGVNGSIDLTGEITVTGQTASYFYSGVPGEVELTSVLTVIGQTANYDYTAIDGEVELVGSLIVEGQTANYDYNAIQAEVILQGEVVVTGATASYNYEAISGVVNVFETWAIKQPVNSSWTIQQETQTNWSKK